MDLGTDLREAGLAGIALKAAALKESLANVQIGVLESEEGLLSYMTQFAQTAQSKQRFRSDHQETNPFIVENVLKSKGIPVPRLVRLAGISPELILTKLIRFI
ncbi:MAG: hypothetical protein AABX51_02410 [Nanoarchaeota archaeon]